MNEDSTFIRIYSDENIINDEKIPFKFEWDQDANNVYITGSFVEWKQTP